MPGLFWAAKRRLCAISVNLACVTAILLAVNFLVAAGTQAQSPPNVFCVVKRDVPHAGKTITEHSVVRCDNLAGIGAEWRLVARDLTFVAASAQRDSLNAAATPEVWCVVRRDALHAGRAITEHSVVRCDNLAGIGAEWRLVSRDLTFSAASAQRDALNAGETPAVWCVAVRDVPHAGKTITEQSVVRCDNLAGIGAEWRVLSRDLTFAAASAQRDALSAANAPPVWCVARRDVLVAGRAAVEYTVVRCDNLAGIGAEWRVAARDLTFAAASAQRDSLNAAAGAIPQGPTLAQLAAQCTQKIPGSVPGNRNPDGTVPCVCINGQINIAGRCVDPRAAAAAQCTQSLPGSVVGARNADGSYQCACPTGQGNLNGRCVSEREIAAAQCTASLPGSIVGSRDASGSYRCACPAGQVNADGRCQDERTAAAAQCTQTLAGSVPGARNADGSYPCNCPAGQTGIGSQCVNEQAYADTQCNNTTPGSRSTGRNPNGSYNCACPTGQVVSAGQCVSETANAAAQCSQILPGSVPGSRNANGSYSCVCPQGFVSQGNQCVNQQAEYTNAAAQCSRILAGSVPGQRNANGSYTCVCPAGAVQAGNQCVNQQAEYNNAAAQCAGILQGGVPGSRNANGSYNCVCPPGLVSNGRQCIGQVVQQPSPPPPRQAANVPPPAGRSLIHVGNWTSKIGVTIALRADRTGSWIDSRKPGPMQGGGDFPGTWTESSNGVTLTIARKAGFGPERAGGVSFTRQPNGSLRDPWGNEYFKR